jgi:hypothetical protein
MTKTIREALFAKRASPDPSPKTPQIVFLALPRRGAASGVLPAALVTLAPRSRGAAERHNGENWVPRDGSCAFQKKSK